MVKRRTAGESGISRLITLLEAFDGEEVVSRGELVRRSGVPEASGYRLVRELVSHGLLEVSEGGLRTGLRLWELGARGSSFSRLASVARPHLEGLHAVVGQHALLWVLDGSEAVCVEQLSAVGSVTNIAQVAGRLPARAVTPGIVLAAFGTPDERVALLQSRPAKVAAGAPQTERDLRRVLAETRRLGFSRADGWIAPHVSARGFPVRDATGRVMAALSVVLPNEAAALATAVPAGHRAAREASLALGWRPGPPPITE